MSLVSGLIEDSWILVSAATSVCFEMLFGLKYMKNTQPYCDVRWQQRCVVADSKTSLNILREYTEKF